VKAAGMVPLVVAPVGGKLPNGMTVQRTFGATRSVEFDALLVAGRPVAAADAHPARDSKAGEPSEPGLDPRVVLLLQESFRHAKALGAWGAGVQALEESGVDANSPGVVTAGSAAVVFGELHEVLGGHRVWERFTPVLV